MIVENGKILPEPCKKKAVKKEKELICKVELFGDKGGLYVVKKSGLLTYYCSDGCPLICRSSKWQSVLIAKFEKEIQAYFLRVRNNQKELDESIEVKKKAAKEIVDKKRKGGNWLFADDDEEVESDE